MAERRAEGKRVARRRGKNLTKPFPTFTRTSIKIFSLEKNTIGKAEIEFNLNEEKHEYIVDMVLDSSKGNPYECHIAAKYSSITSI